MCPAGGLLAHRRPHALHTKHQPGGRAEPLPEIKPYESFVYNAYDLRSPFLPSSRGSGAGLGVRPDQKRNREFLERYSPELAKPIPLAIPALTDGKIFL